MEKVGKLKVVCLQVMRGGTFKGIRERMCGESICPFISFDKHHAYDLFLVLVNNYEEDVQF